jgi:DNA-binding CsgD family transcriptional regulator
LEFYTPIPYFFPYLYAGPILLTNSWLGRRANFQATFAAVFLTMLNLVVPGGEVMKASTIASRAIAAMALIVTGVLSDRVRRSEEAIALTRAKLEAQVTQREQEILSFLAARKTNQQIALELYITPGTVRVHVHAILHKLEVSDRAQAVVVGLQKRLIKSDLIDCRRIVITLNPIALRKAQSTERQALQVCLNGHEAVDRVRS